MELMQKITDTWMRQNELIKIFCIVVLVLFFLWIYGAFDADNRGGSPGIALDENGVPVLVDIETGDRLPQNSCTIEKGSSQCETAKEKKFRNQSVEQILVITAQADGSTRCCRTVYHGGEQGEDCRTFQADLNRCPSRFPLKK